MKTLPFTRFRRAASALAAACGLFAGAVAQAQPTITTNYPDGTVQFQYTNTLSIAITSTAPGGVSPTNISIQFTITNLSDVSSVTNLTVTNGLTVTGTPTDLLVTTPLTSNLTYTAVIVAIDSSGALTNDLTFDTVIPSYTWEAEDFDYTITNADGTFVSGQFFDNPQTNAYAGLAGLVDVDANNPNNGGNAYRPTPASGDSGILGNEVTSDVPRVQYLNSGLDDYDQGWNNGGSGLWGNYTRHYPAGKWNIFARSAGFAAPSESATMTENGPKGTLLGQFVVPETWTTATEYQNFTWAPLTDVAGNLVEWDTDGTQKTLTINVGNGSYNMNYYMLMPINPNYKPVPFVSNVQPNSATNMFASSSTFSFTANSIPGLVSSNVVFTLNGVSPAGVTVTGSSNALTFSTGLESNIVYTAVIKLTDINGSSTYTTTFGTFPTNYYTWEAEDWDYTSTNSAGTPLLTAQFFDNPQVDDYFERLGTPGVDANNTASGAGEAYRTSDTGDLGNEVTGDLKRAQYVATGSNDYDAGWTGAGNWANYTRHYPAGTYNVYMRVASPSGQTDAARLLLVTNGVGTATQSTTVLGTFNAPLTGGYQNWSWTPLVDANGNPVAITTTTTTNTNGATSTFQMYEDNGGWNANFFMLVPPDTSRPSISGFSPTSTNIFQPSNTLSFVITSPTAINTNYVTLTLNGVAVTGLVFSGSPTNMTVTYSHLQPNTPYTADVFVNNANNDPGVSSVRFDTFTPNYYTWEAEDWDYNNGEFFDNPQVDLYFGLYGSAEVDAYNNSGGGTAYRPNSGGDLGNEVTGDVLRAQYIAADTNDYDIGWTGAGNWANYTRTYPAGSYNVYLRGASPSGQTDAASFSEVTSGLGTTTQGTNFLGKFNVPLTGGYQSWIFTPLVNSSGDMVVVTTTGKPMTFQMYEDNGGWNANFFMLVPAVATAPSISLSLALSGSTINLSFPTQTGSTYQIQYKTTLSDPTWTTLGTAVTGTGSTASVQDTIGATSRFYRAVITP